MNECDLRNISYMTQVRSVVEGHDSLEGRDCLGGHDSHPTHCDQVCVRVCVCVHVCVKERGRGGTNALGHWGSIA